MRVLSVAYILLPDRLARPVVGDGGFVVAQW